MNIDLTWEEVDTILDWFNCYRSEGSVSRDDEILHSKLGEHESKTFEEKTIKKICDDGFEPNWI